MSQQPLTEMPVLPEKDISSSAVTRPPSLMSCPALILRCRSSCCVAPQAPFRAEDVTSGTSSPTCMMKMLSSLAVKASFERHGLVVVCAVPSASLIALQGALKAPQAASLMILYGRNSCAQNTASRQKNSKSLIFIRICISSPSTLLWQRSNLSRDWAAGAQ